MKYIALNHTKKAGYDLHTGQWERILRVHPELLEYRAKRENINATLAAGLFDKPVDKLTSLELVKVTSYGPVLAQFNIEYVLPENLAVERYPSYYLIGSLDPQMESVIAMMGGSMRLSNLLEGGHT